MTEHTFIRAVHRKLPRGIHHWKIAARFARGVPDAWYSGDGGDVWVEYKYLTRTPAKSFTPDLTALQKAWLNKRKSEGRNVAVVVGCPDGAVVLRHWDGQIQTNTMDWLDIDGVVTWIATQTLSSCTVAASLAS